MSRASRFTSLRAYVFIGLVLHAVRLLLLTEEEEGEEVGDFGSALRTPSLPIELADPNRQRYLDAISSSILSQSRAAQRARRRFLLSNAVSIASAGAVPVVVAMPAPGWVAGALGGLAALVQGLQQLLQDGRMSLEHHVLAVKLSAAKRLLLLALTTQDEEMAFGRFASEVEQLYTMVGARVEKTLNTAVHPKAEDSTSI